MVSRNWNRNIVILCYNKRFRDSSMCGLVACGLVIKSTLLNYRVIILSLTVAWRKIFALLSFFVFLGNVYFFVFIVYISGNCNCVTYLKKIIFGRNQIYYYELRFLVIQRLLYIIKKVSFWSNVWFIVFVKQHAFPIRFYAVLYC